MSQCEKYLRWLSYLDNLERSKDNCQTIQPPQHQNTKQFPMNQKCFGDQHESHHSECNELNQDRGNVYSSNGQTVSTESSRYNDHISVPLNPRENEHISSSSTDQSPGCARYIAPLPQTIADLNKAMRTIQRPQQEHPSPQPDTASSSDQRSWVDICTTATPESLNGDSYEGQTAQGQGQYNNGRLEQTHNQAELGSGLGLGLGLGSGIHGGEQKLQLPQAIADLNKAIKTFVL